MPGTPLLASALESTRRLQVEFHPDKSGQIRYKLSEGKMASAPPKVLISYSHDSSEHEERVLTFTDRLRGDGIDCIIDQRPGKNGGYPNFASDVSCVPGCRGDSVARHSSFKTWSRLGIGDRLRGSHLDQDQVSLYSQPPVFPGLVNIGCAHETENKALAYNFLRLV